MLIGIPVAVLTFLLSFYPVNNQPFSHFLESAVRYLRNDKLYLWRKKGTGAYGTDEKVSGNPNYTPPTNTSDNINTLARRLELKAIQKDSR